MISFLFLISLFQHRVLDPSKFVTSEATSIFLNLEPNAELIIHENFFQHNHLNRISIVGKNRQGTVEIGSKAFIGNRAPFPEIVFENLAMVTIQSNVFMGNFVKSKLIYMLSLVHYFQLNLTVSFFR